MFSLFIWNRRSLRGFTFFFFFFVPSLHGLLVCVCLAGRGFLRASHSLGKHSEDALAHTRVIRVVQKYILIFSSFSPQFAVILYIYIPASKHLPTYIYIYNPPFIVLVTTAWSWDKTLGVTVVPLFDCCVVVMLCCWPRDPPAGP